MTHKTIIPLLLALCTVCCLFPAPANAQDPSISRPFVMPKPEAESKNKKACPGVVYATLDGIRFHLPISFFMTFRMPDGSVVDKSTPNLHPAFNCTVKDMGNVRSFFTGFFSANDVGIELSPKSEPFADGYPAQSYYSAFKGLMMDRLKKGLSVTMPDGSHKFEWDLAQAYMLPRETSPTLQTDEAAVIRCTLTEANAITGLCNGRYFLPDGLFISYTFGRSHFDETDFSLLDRQIRTRVEKLKVKQQ